MRWFILVVLGVVLATALADPDPKKYKTEIKPKIKDSNSDLTDEEKKFLREVEAKFGIKSEVPINTEVVDDSSEDEEEEDDEETLKPPPSSPKAPFPAVIAIEIVNDTDVKNGSTKGKRTIDANLGYGYRTNSGYTYTYLGKSGQQQGKFMIYPYSQEDIPPISTSGAHPGYPQQSGKTTKLSPNVEITPSQAFELVPTKEEEQTSYNYEKPSVQLNTKYEDIHSVESPPPPYPASDSNASPPSTLYTTYNGQQFSSLIGHFPKIMSNYLVDSSQLLNNPTYQSAGITQDHLRPHAANLGQRVVPVLVLRIPSSYIKDPSAELYANLPQNYPLSQYLNNVNLQELVNQYFKKIGYPVAPKVMAYPSSSLAEHSTSSALQGSVHSSISSSSHSGYQPQHYNSPYVQPSYTHADYSGVQYSAVQPVMAKYPAGYTSSRQQYYVMRPQSMYQQPIQQQQYVYRYKYVPQTSSQSQSYYSQPQYQHQQEPEEQHVSEQHSGAQDTNSHVEYNQHPSAQDTHSHDEYNQNSDAQDTSSHVEYNQQSSSGEEQVPAAEYENSHVQSSHGHEETQYDTSNYESGTTAAPSYENEVSTPEYGPTPVPSHSSHGSSHSVQVQYDQGTPKETIAVFSRGQTGHQASAQNYIYQNINNGHSGSESLVLHENYPSKDHTIATVLPLSYKRQQSPEPVQTVSYVTPVPTMKFHSQYRIMVPQTVLRRPTEEKVSYVHSHSLPSAYSGSAAASQYNPEELYTSGNQYGQGLTRQSLKLPSFSRNFHIHPKRMAKPEDKSDSLTSRKTEKSEKKKSS